ncbi:quinone-modifying oxidoreductase, subunit QmoB [Desulfovibrionales bacterium]
MADNIGVYICLGCNISKSIDVESLVYYVREVHNDICSVVKNHPMFCGRQGVAMIKADIHAKGLDGVLVAACSGRVKWDIFQFDSVYVERVNIREGCAWSVGETKDGVGGHAQNIVQDYIKMGMVKLKNMKKIKLEEQDVSKTILVIGGGFTGLTVALNVAAAGYDVVLVEKQAELGGSVRNFYKTTPLGQPYVVAQPVGIDQKIAAVQASDKIVVYISSRVINLAGAPGLYDCTLKTPDGEKTIRLGAVVIAAGWVEQDKQALASMGYGSIKNVITSMEFEYMAKAGNIIRPGDGKDVQKAVFLVNIALAVPEDMYKLALQPIIEAALVSDKNEDEPKGYIHQDLEGPQHLLLTNTISSMVALKQAGYVREKNPQAISYVFYDSMIVMGIYERYYKAVQDDPGIMFTKGEVISIVEDADGGVLVRLADTLFGESIEVKVDLVVLPTGIVPATAKDPIMYFQYRQGLNFPDLSLFDGYVDSNYICFPYETRRTGVYAAGCIRQPMLMDQAEDDAAGAALKAIQCVSSANRGVAVHPRSGDRSYPVFNFVRCTQCKRCTEECPFGALDDDEKGTPKPNPTRCRRCGTCMGACPERAIGFDNYNIGMLSEMIRQYDVPTEISKGGPRVLILACENDAYPALDMAAFRGKKWSPYVRIMAVRCLGSVNVVWIKDAISRGTDGVMLLGCKYSDNYQCHFVKGSELCNRRKENIAETLKQLGIESDRVEQFQVAIDDYDKVPDMINEFVEMIIEKGPNPFKGY